MLRYAATLFDYSYLSRRTQDIHLGIALQQNRSDKTHKSPTSGKNLYCEGEGSKLFFFIKPYTTTLLHYNDLQVFMITTGTAVVINTCALRNKKKRPTRTNIEIRKYVFTQTNISSG